MKMQVFLMVQLFLIGFVAQKVDSFTYPSMVQVHTQLESDAENIDSDAVEDADLDQGNNGNDQSSITQVPNDDDALTNLEDAEDENVHSRADSRQNRRRHGRRHHANTTSATTDDKDQDHEPKPNPGLNPSSNENAPDELLKSEKEHGQVTTATVGSANAVSQINTDFPAKTDEESMDKAEDAVHSHAADKTEGKSSKYVSSACPKCTRVEQEKQLRMDEVKNTILKRLGLSNVPKIDGPIHPLPFDFYTDDAFAMKDQGSEDVDEEVEEVDEHSVRTKEIFIFGKDVTEQCVQQKGTGCYSFNLTSQTIDPRAVASVELWVYKQTDLNDHYIQTFMVSELSEHAKGEIETLRSRSIIKRLETRLKYGWMKFYVKRTVLRWLSKPHRNKGLAVTCQTCKRRSHRTIYGDKEGLMPILVFYMKNEVPKRRTKRSANCIEGGNNCCHKESLEIHFSEIGWDYIMAPLSIRPNYCIGSCNGILAAHYNHTRLAQTLKQTMAYNHLNLQPCCSPVSFRHPQSLIYRDNNNVVRKVDVPDLIVGECGCA